MFSEQGEMNKVASVPSFEKIIKLRKQIYSKLFPKVNMDGYDIYDYFCRIWFSCDEGGNVISTSRLVIDSASGLPSEALVNKYIQAYRDKGLRLAEFGRLISVDKKRFNSIRGHFRCAYQEAINNNVDIVILITSLAKQSFYQKLIGAHLVCKDIGEDFGSNDTFALYVWDIKQSNKRFLKWVGLDSKSETLFKEVI